MTCIGIAGKGTRINGAPVRASTETDPSQVIACLSDPDAFDETTEPGMQALRAASRWNVYDGGCIGHAALASGHVGVALSGSNLEPFDIAALVPVVEGAGGVISDWRGGGLDATSEGAIVATANPALHGKVLDLLV
jgi:fructose-1,6-bisphosphatase/inositol monophosphatase family enzyme